MKKQYPWALVGPWYRKDSAGGTLSARSVRPIFQKYASSNFVKALLDEPQHSLRYACEDFVNRRCRDVTGLVEPEDLGSSDRLKLFLDTHNRFYVVVCELHCLAPGFPSVSREQVCEAGFVVRRRRPRVPAAGRRELAVILARRKRIYAKIGRLTQHGAPKQVDALAVGKAGPGAVVDALGGDLASGQLDKLTAELQRNDGDLAQFNLKYGVTWVLEGWKAGEHEGSGAWQGVEETPVEVDEDVLPLYPLIPDPTVEGHTAEGKSLWYGVVPTQSASVDGEGAPRFDDQSLYEVRCFVRRHKPACPRKPGRNDCHGEMVWSLATEAYQLASFYDLDGNGHRQINIPLPNLDDLRNQVQQMPPGRGANVRMTSPEGSSLNFTTNDFELPGSSASPGGGQVCFFAIFLITLIALFVLRLFLPVVVWLFNLWFLLALRLCIPPGISIGGGIAADLKVQPPSLDADLALGVSVNIGGNIVSSATEFRSLIEANFDPEGNLDPKLKTGLMDALEASPYEMLQVVLSASADFSETPVEPALAATEPHMTDGLDYFTRVNPR